MLLIILFDPYVHKIPINSSEISYVTNFDDVKDEIKDYMKDKVKQSIEKRNHYSEELEKEREKLISLQNNYAENMGKSLKDNHNRELKKLKEDYNLKIKKLEDIISDNDKLINELKELKDDSQIAAIINERSFERVLSTAGFKISKNIFGQAILKSNK